MKALKIIGIVLLVFVILFFGIAFFLPSEVHVERSKVIPAKAEVVFTQINDLQKWEDWSPWHKMDPDMQITYGDSKAGVGAWYSWTSETLGDGKLTITESRPYEYIETDLDFMEEGTAIGYYRFEPQNGGTKVVWGMDSDMGSGAVGKYMGLMMDGMVGSSFEEGLANLEELVKDLPADTAAGAIPDSSKVNE